MKIIARIFGYMTAAEAKACGCTHHGSYFGIPLWMGGVETDAPLVATKFAWMEPLMDVAHWIEQTMAGAMFPDAMPVFQFTVLQAIE